MIVHTPPPDPPASAMGMDNTTAAFLGQNTWAKVTGMTVRSGFGSTSIVNDGLVMDGAGAKTVTFKGTFQASGIGNPRFQAYLNGTAIGSAVAPGTVGTVTGVTVVAGDRLELWGFSDAFGAQWETTSPGSTNTYLYTD